jgi:hypothetical protein
MRNEIDVFRYVCFSVIVMIVSAASGIDTLKITGRVVDCCDQPLAGATISLPSFPLSTVSRDDGTFILTAGNKTIHHFAMEKRYQLPDRADLFDLQGRKARSVKRKENPFPRRQTGPMTVMITRYSSDHNHSIIKKSIVSGSGFPIQWPAVPSSVSIKKNLVMMDSIQIKAQNYAGIIRTISSYAADLGSIQLVRYGSRINDCSAMFTSTDSLARSGISLIADSLTGSNASFEWSADRLFTPLKGPDAACLLSARPWGVYSECQSVGMSGSYSTAISGMYGMPLLKALESGVSLSGQIGGIACMGGTTIDTSLFVTLRGGRVVDQSQRTIESIKVSIKNVKRLPFDSLVLLNYFKGFRAEFLNFFADSEPVKPDTLVLNSDRFNDTASRVAFNSHGKVSCRIENRTILGTGTIVFEAGADVRHCCIMAGRIIIKDASSTDSRFYSVSSAIELDGESHGSQFFSSDSIIINERAVTDSASLLISEFTPANRAVIYIKKNRNLCGTVISFNGSGEISSMMAVILEDSTDFRGSIITDNILSIKNVRITGRIYALSLATTYNNVGYINYLIGVSLRRETQPVLFPLLGAVTDGVSFVEKGKSNLCK